MIDANAWIKLVIAFDAAKEDLLKLAEKARDLGQGSYSKLESISSGWEALSI
jgi:hypothetical protein